jgi:ribonuclease E
VPAATIEAAEVVAEVEPMTTVSASPAEPPAAMPEHAAPAPVAPVPPSPPIIVAAPTASAAPYVLPIEDLRAVAAGSGLEWVQSDADKIAAVQAAIAAAPKPAHVPRERKVVLLPDEGPLVLVETRKDLSQLKLPFETGAR